MNGSSVAESGRQVPRNGLATPLPVTDGKNVFFMYGSGNISQKYGYSSSLLLFGNKLYCIAK